MDFHLLVPNLFWPAAAGAEPYGGLPLPALETLLSRGSRARTSGSSLERWLADAFQLAPPEAPPLAPLALLGEGVAPGTQYWFAADPVHLKVHGAQLILADPSRLALARPEAGELIAALNMHFAPSGIEFLAPRADRWYARVPGAPRVLTTPTGEVAGKPIEPFLPAGEDGARWRAVFNEAQMVLHQQAGNERREARGELPVNSIWFWGGGRLAHSTNEAPYDIVCSNHPLAAGLAVATAATASPLPETGAALLQLAQGAPHGRRLLATIEMPLAAAYGDVPGWREAVLALEQRWLAPLLAAWRDLKLDTVTLHALGPDSGYRVELAGRDRYCFWRLRRPLQSYAG